ncbi:MAG: hypothetical protein WBO24_21230, partial [Nitrospirales bacterium]
SQRDSPEKNSGVFKKARPARPQPLGRAERTEVYVSTAKGRERRWRHFSTLPFIDSPGREETVCLPRRNAGKVTLNA